MAVNVTLSPSEPVGFVLSSSWPLLHSCTSDTSGPSQPRGAWVRFLPDHPWSAGPSPAPQPASPCFLLLEYHPPACPQRETMRLMRKEWEPMGRNALNPLDSLERGVCSGHYSYFCGEEQHWFFFIQEPFCLCTESPDHWTFLFCKWAKCLTHGLRVRALKLNFLFPAPGMNCCFILQVTGRSSIHWNLSWVILHYFKFSLWGLVYEFANVKHILHYA